MNSEPLGSNNISTSKTLSESKRTAERSSPEISEKNGSDTAKQEADETVSAASNADAAQRANRDVNGAEPTSEAMTEPRTKRRGTLAGRAFWITVFILLGFTLILVFLASLAGDEQETKSVVVAPNGPSSVVPAPPSVELSPSRVERLVQGAAQAAYLQTEKELDSELDLLFQPVLANVEVYADFHYSVIGEYTELFTLALKGSLSARKRVQAWWNGENEVKIDEQPQSTIEAYLSELDQKLHEGLEEKLYNDFETRWELVVARLDAVFNETFQAELARLTKEFVSAEGTDAVLSAASEVVLERTVDRAMLGKPMSATLATAAGAAGTKLVASTLAKVSAKAAAKTAGKAATKGLFGVGVGAAGAALGFTLGPVGAVVGGLTGAVAAWFAVDYAVIKVDEALTRDEFESDIRSMISERKAELHKEFKMALSTRLNDLVGQTLQDRISD